MMPSLDAYPSSAFVKLLLIGIPMSGKTGALMSLVREGYKLRILDYDAKLHTLVQYVQKFCPDKIANVDARTLRDRTKASALGSMLDGIPSAFADGLKMLDKWTYKDGEKTIDLGKPSDWGADTVLVIDSLTLFSVAAFDFADQLVPGGSSGKKDPRAIYREAQGAVLDVLRLLTGDSFKTNVIVTAHIDYQDLPDGTKKGFPTSVGKAIGPNIPALFPSMIMVTTVNGKHTMRTTASALLDLANPAPFNVPETLTLDTGLADFFKIMKGKQRA